MIIPESIKIVDNIVNVNVFIEINERPKNIIEKAREQIEIRNSLSKYDYKILSNSTFVKLDPKNIDVDNINPDDALFFIDVKDYSEGSYSVPNSLNSYEIKVEAIDNDVDRPNDQYLSMSTQSVTIVDDR